MLEMLCSAEEKTLTARLRSGVNPVDCEPAFQCACACMAAAALEEVRSRRDEVRALRVGDVSVTPDTRDAGHAAALRRQAKLLMAPYIAAAGFAFCGVKG